MDKDYQGHGYATEAARALIEYGTTTLDIHPILLFVTVKMQPPTELWKSLE